ncbi:MAG: KH domain-containing protein [Bacillales bacterium]
MGYTSLIKTIIDPIVTDPKSVLIRENLSENKKDLEIVIVSQSEDTGRLIGKKGVIANAIRNVVSVKGKLENTHIHLKFESFDGDK